MPLRIRLTRTGKKKQAQYRLVVTDSPSPRDGRFLEQVGSYDPRKKPPELNLKTDRVIHWLEKGASPSDTVGQLLKKQGLWPLSRSSQEASADSRPDEAGA
jgi:small subunit ribosomal protein S16